MTDDIPEAPFPPDHWWGSWGDASRRRWWQWWRWIEHRRAA